MTNTFIPFNLLTNKYSVKNRYKVNTPQKARGTYFDVAKDARGGPV